MEKAQIIPSELTICVERVTKAIASYYYNLSTGNRSVSSDYQHAMKKEQSKDNWIADSGQGLTFDIDGELVDGHTRLLAFINSPEPYMDITVVRGVNKLAKLIFDTGRKRTASATLAIHGVKHSSRVSTILSLYTQYKDGNFAKFRAYSDVVRRRTSSITNATMMRVYNQEKEFIDKYASALSKYSHTKSQLQALTPRIVTFVGYLLYKQSNDLNKVFKVLDTINLGVGADSRLANFRNTIMQIDLKNYMSDEQKVDLVIRMILYISDKSNNLYYPNSDKDLKTLELIENIIL